MSKQRQQQQQRKTSNSPTNPANTPEHSRHRRQAPVFNFETARPHQTTSVSTPFSYHTGETQRRGKEEHQQEVKQTQRQVSQIKSPHCVSSESTLLLESGFIAHQVVEVGHMILRIHYTPGNPAWYTLRIVCTSIYLYYFVDRSQISRIFRWFAPPCFVDDD